MANLMTGNTFVQNTVVPQRCIKYSIDSAFRPRLLMWSTGITAARELWHAARYHSPVSRNI